MLSSGAFYAQYDGHPAADLRALHAALRAPPHPEELRRRALHADRDEDLPTASLL